MSHADGAAERIDRIFESSPSLPALFARAALTGRLHHGDAVAPRTYALTERTVDVGNLVAYQQVCGFRIGDVLPPTYLHLLAFPLSVVRMTERDFPFPLVGLVHVANTITQHRPVRLAESVSVAVRAQNVEPHPAGRTVELIGEGYCRGDLVWESRSLYLRRGGGTGSPGPKSEREPAAAPAAPGALIKVPDDIGRRYAAVAGDVNPIHLHGLTARAFGFPKAIAHGMWLKARVLATLQGRLPDAFTVDVAFKTPVFLPSTVEVIATPSGTDWSLEVHNARSGKPHLTGTITAH